MTQPPTPGDMARVDQVTADANRFLDSILTDAVTQLQAGMPRHRLVHRIGGALVRHQITPLQLNVLVAIGAARLAELHHAIEQLADVFEGDQPTAVPSDEGYREAMTHAAWQVRKLVDP